MPSPSQSLTDVIRAAGGIVHGDGNIFFTSHAQFQSAVEAISRPTPPEAQAGAGMKVTDEQIMIARRTTFKGDHAPRASDLAFARAILALAAPKAVAQAWISVEERLPPAITHIIAHGRQYGDLNRKRPLVYVTYTGTRVRETVEDEEITHWQPLPLSLIHI